MCSSRSVGLIKFDSNINLQPREALLFPEVAGLAAARQGAEVFVTDLPEMLPLLAANIGVRGDAAAGFGV